MWAGLRAGALAAVIVAGSAVAVLAQIGPRYHTVGFDDLLGWAEDDHTAALGAFLKSCEDISAREWAPLCTFAADAPDARRFFETFFVPVVVRPAKRALFTGYYEPILDGSRVRQGRFQTPIFAPPRVPKDEFGHWPSRAEIDAGALTGLATPIVWVDDPVAAYYLHIQGSGRVRLRDGSTIRLGYAAENGHIFRSAARELLRLGLISPSAANLTGMRAYYERNPDLGRTALNFNDSYVFFREIGKMPEEHGPLGALERPMTAERTIAVDPQFTQMGAPVWIEKGGRDPIRRLMVAQDTGAAIKGPQRADIFFGTGDDAGRQASITRDSGRMVVLLPIDIALKLDPVN
jgi:membrane-bound lytic murein transglycosylase A